MNSLVLGPMLRHVDETSATVWVEVAEAGEVRLVAGDRSTTAPTFGAHGHHYALLGLDGLEPGTRLEYQVELAGRQVWPEPDSGLPPSLIPTLDHSRPLRIAFGSCRTSVGHDESGNRTHGIDALRAYALRMAGLTSSDHREDPDPGPGVRWPDLVLFLGDQVYADETTDEMREFISSRRDIDEEPGPELKDYEEYAHLYKLAWSDPVNRWLLSTLPSAMIFDDHDIRDDWNTSVAWRQKMAATSWWHGRIVAGLGSYWVYQHLGNLTPAERSQDPLWRLVEAYDGPGEIDLSNALDDLADRADQDSSAYRWSYVRDFGTQARLVVVDSRAARVVEPCRRSILDEGEMAWLDEHVRGGFDHLFIGTSLPFLLAPGLHHVEAFSEALASGAWGYRAAGVGELLRQAVDLEHWAAFQDAFQQVSQMVLEVARGQRGPLPKGVTFLSGDVHHSYLSEARPASGDPVHARIVQAVCSPIRNPLPKAFRFATAFLSYGVAGPIGRVVARSATVPKPPLQWRYRGRPWFDNNLATLEVQPQGLRLWWARGAETEDRQRPRLVQVAEHFITP